MQKLKNTFIDRMIERRCTSAEVDFLLFVGQYQNDHGVIQSVYYKEICGEIGISFQKFYDILKSLTQKGLIEYEKRYHTDVVVKLIDNDFSGMNDSFKEGYLNVNAVNFRSDLFKGLKANEKLLYLYFKRFMNGKHELVGNFYAKFSKLLGIERRSVRGYLKTLKEKGLIHIAKKRNRALHYEMTIRNTNKLKLEPGERIIESVALDHNLIGMVKRNFSKYLPEQNPDVVVYNIVQLIHTYKERGIDGRFGVIVKGIEESLKKKASEGSKMILNAALVNESVMNLFMRYHLSSDDGKTLFLY